MIEQIERFICGRCGYISESKHIIEQIKKTGVCSACQNGKPKVWEDCSKRTEGEANQ